MNWSSALNGFQWTVLGLVPPLVFLLYFLKLRRRPLEVPSTYLWRRALEDMHVNSLWQRLRRNLLLLLQLLFLAALIFACLRPSRFGDRETGRRWILLIDNSASMQAADLPTSRLAVAKTKAREQLSKMNRGDIAMVIAFSDRADIRQGFTDDRNRLQQAIDGVEPTQRTTDIREALRASSGLANPGRKSFDGKNDIQVAEALPATVFVYSDGDFPTFSEFDRGNLAIEYIPVGGTAIDNVAIEAFSVDRNDEKPEDVRAYARLVNHGPQTIVTTASLYRGTTLLDAVTASIEAGKEKGLQFDFNVATDVVEEYRLELDRRDQLPLDNQAYAVLKPERRLRIAVYTPGNSALEKSLATNAVRAVADVVFLSLKALDDEDKQSSDGDEIDLVVFDQCSPAAMPNASTLFIGRKPPGDEWKFSEPTGPIQIVDVDRSHPITEYLEIGNIRIVEGRSITAPEGGQTLIRADNGPMMCLAPRGPYQDAVLGFEIVQTKSDATLINTDWSIKRSFPVFVMACIEQLAGGVTQSTSTSVRPGLPVTIRLAGRVERAVVKLPQGASTEVERNASGLFIWTDTDKLGAYQIVDANDRILDSFAVNLFSPQESRLLLKPSIGIGEDKIAAVSTSQRGRVEYWRWMLLAGLAVLVGEWVVYNRRVLV